MRARSRPSETRMDQRITASRGPAVDEAPLDVGSMVEVTSNTGATVYGVIRWKGSPVGKTGEWAGIELVSPISIEQYFIAYLTSHVYVFFVCLYVFFTFSLCARQCKYTKYTKTYEVA